MGKNVKNWVHGLQCDCTPFVVPYVASIAFTGGGGRGEKRVVQFMTWHLVIERCLHGYNDSQFMFHTHFLLSSHSLSDTHKTLTKSHAHKHVKKSHAQNHTRTKTHTNRKI